MTAKLCRVVPRHPGAEDPAPFKEDAEGVSSLRHAPPLLVLTWRPKHHWTSFACLHIHASDTL